MRNLDWSTDTGMNKYKFRPTNATTKSSVELKNRWLIKLETKRISHDLNLSLLRLIHHLTSMIEPLKQHRNEIWDDIVNLLFLDCKTTVPFH